MSWPWFPECERCGLVRFSDGRCAVYSRKPSKCTHFIPHEPVLLAWIECLTCAHWDRYRGFFGNKVWCRKLERWVDMCGAKYVSEKGGSRFRLCVNSCWEPNELFEKRFPEVSKQIKQMLSTKMLVLEKILSSEL